MIILDAANMTTREAAHDYLQARLRFPDHYGKNLDALFDCLTELDATELAFVEIRRARGSYFDKVLAVFQEAAEENPGLQISIAQE